MNNTTDDEFTRLLRSGSSNVPHDQLARLHAKLADQAQTNQLLDIAYRTVDSPLGSLLLATTPHGLVRVAYASQDHDAVLTELADRISPRILAAPGQLDQPARELEEYFTGRRYHFDLALDLQLTTEFRWTVLNQLPNIGYGHTASYKAVAAAAGRPKAVRAVGSACATNPLPLVIPCHRVTHNDGTLGSYVGGATAKQTLINLEAGQTSDVR
jgi:methylated-DNA-[protein]-cysteine S-methyltransferase